MHELVADLECQHVERQGRFDILGATRLWASIERSRGHFGGFALRFGDVTKAKRQNTCCRKARPNWSPVAERVTTTPDAVDISNAGTCATKASPTESIVNVELAFARSIPFDRPINS